MTKCKLSVTSQFENGLKCVRNGWNAWVSQQIKSSSSCFQPGCEHFLFTISSESDVCTINPIPRNSRCTMNIHSLFDTSIQEFEKYCLVYCPLQMYVCVWSTSMGRVGRINGMLVWRVCHLSQYQHFYFDTNTKFSITILDTETILETDSILIWYSISKSDWP